MEKRLALILAAALVLSLAACGEAEDTDTPSDTPDDAPSDATTDAPNNEDEDQASADVPSAESEDAADADTPSDDGEDNTKEELLANAEHTSLYKMQSAYNENKVRAEETFLGNNYKVFCFVDEIGSEYFDYEISLLY